MASQMFSPVMEEMPIETLKEEMVAMVQEEMPFRTMIEELAPPPPASAMEEMEEEPKEVVGLPSGPAQQEETIK